MAKIFNVFVEGEQGESSMKSILKDSSLIGGALISLKAWNGLSNPHIIESN